MIRLAKFSCIKMKNDVIAGLWKERHISRLILGLLLKISRMELVYPQIVYMLTVSPQTARYIKTHTLE